MMKQRVIAILPRIFAIVAVVVILGAALGAGSALAAKGGIKGKPDGNGGHGGNGNKTVATMTVSPNPVAAGAVYEVTGSGFAKNSTVYVGVAGHCCLAPVTTDSSGSFTVTQSGLSVPGSYTAISMVYSHKSWVIGASAPFEVT